MWNHGQTATKCEWRLQAVAPSEQKLTEDQKTWTIETAFLEHNEACGGRVFVSCFSTLSSVRSVAEMGVFCAPRRSRMSKLMRSQALLLARRGSSSSPPLHHPHYPLYLLLLLRRHAVLRRWTLLLQSATICSSRKQPLQLVLSALTYPQYRQQVTEELVPRKQER